MKTIGLIGGMSWESTAMYYRIINQEVARRCGGLSSASICMNSLNFEEVARLQRLGAWGALTDKLERAARQLVQADADCIVICTNTMHMVAPELMERISAPFIHITDVTAAACNEAGHRVVGLLGTRFTMEGSFYVERMSRHGVACLIPNLEDRLETHRIIFEELCRGVVVPESMRRLHECVDEFRLRGAEAVVLGCTELPMILSPKESCLPLLDTTRLHALSAVNYCLQ